MPTECAHAVLECAFDKLLKSCLYIFAQSGMEMNKKSTSHSWTNGEKETCLLYTANIRTRTHTDTSLNARTRCLDCLCV